MYIYVFEKVIYLYFFFVRCYIRNVVFEIVRVRELSLKLSGYIEV